jgi:hypothetical protein
VAERFSSVELFSTINVPRRNTTPLKYYLFKVADYRPIDLSADKQADSP